MAAAARHHAQKAAADRHRQQQDAAPRHRRRTGTAPRHGALITTAALHRAPTATVARHRPPTVTVVRHRPPTATAATVALHRAQATTVARHRAQAATMARHRPHAAAVAPHRAVTRQPAFARLRAVLAGALVLGVGATITLAAWTDNEYATGSFQTSVFNTESSTVAAVWASNDSAPGASLAFSATAMSPSVSHFAWINIRTTSASTVGGTITLASSSNNSGALLPALEYRAVRTASSSTTCNAAAFTSGSPTFIVGDATPTYLTDVTTVPGSPVSSAITSPSGELRFCFEVRVKSGAANSYQGTSGTVTWHFAAVSS